MEERSTCRQNLKLITNILISLVILLLCIFVVPKLVLLFMPFVIGWIISCIANPFVMFLERKLKIRRKAGTVVVIVCVIAAVIGMASVSYSGVSYLALSKRSPRCGKS